MVERVPDRFPAAAIDRIIAAGQDIGIADFMMQMELCFAHRIDRHRLSRALALLLDAEPVLGCRLVTEKRQAYWERLPEAGPGLLRRAAGPGDVEEFRITPIDCRTGPQLQACLHSEGCGDRLLLKVSHQACDSGGLGDAAGRLAEIYARLAGNPGYRPRPNYRGSRSCSQVMRRLPWYRHPLLAVLLLRTTLMTQVPKRTHALQVPDGPRRPYAYVIRHIEPGRFERLRAFGRERGASINDLMIAAFYRGLLEAEPWDGRSALRIQTTVDLRRHYLPGAAAGGVCNLSTYEHLRLDDAPGDFAATLGRVSAITRRRKSGWIGLGELATVPLAGAAPYGLLVQACGKFLRDRVMSRNYPSGLTNLGPIAPGRVSFDGEPERAWILPPVVFPPVLYVGFSGYGSTLTLSAGVPLGARDFIEGFFDRMLGTLPG